jgi:hypothetical protein
MFCYVHVKTNLSERLEIKIVTASTSVFANKKLYPLAKKNMKRLQHIIIVKM